MFSQACVKNCVPLPSACWDIHPHPPGQTPPGVDTPRQTPPGQTPSLGRHPPGQTPPGQTPPWADTPPMHTGIHPLAQCMLGYTHPCPVHAGIPPSPNGHGSGPYASYCNAFLSVNTLTMK